MVVFRSFLLFMALNFLWTKAYATRLNSFYLPYNKESVLSIDYGFHYMENKQSGPLVIDVDFTDLKAQDLNIYFEHRVSKWGYSLFYNSTSGTAQIEGVTFVPSTYKFTSYIAEVYSYSFLGKEHHWAFGPKLGLDYSERPFVFADTSTTAQIFKLQTISPLLGVFVDWQSVNWLWSFNLSYRYPALAFVESGDISLTSKVAIKTSLEASYALSPSFRAGLLWQGTIYSGSFSYTSGANSSSGEENVLVSSALLQLNFLF